MSRCFCGCVGRLVKRADVEDNSIPAFKAMRGRIVKVRYRKAKIHWFIDSTPEADLRDCTTIQLVEENEVYN